MDRCGDGCGIARRIHGGPRDAGDQAERECDPSRRTAVEDADETPLLELVPDVGACLVVVGHGQEGYRFLAVTPTAAT